VAVSAIKAAVKGGFRVTTNTTLFDGADPKHYEQFFDDMMGLGVEGMMLSPGYSYQKAPDQEHFLQRQKTQKLFSELLKNRKKSWKFNLSPLFLEFLQGHVDFECTPWGNPTYNIFGWQTAVLSFAGRLCPDVQGTDERHRVGQIRGARAATKSAKDCMVHCGYEPTAVDDTFRIARRVCAHGESGDGARALTATAVSGFRLPGRGGAILSIFERDLCLVSVFSAADFPDYFAIGIGVACRRKKTVAPATASIKSSPTARPASRRCFSVILFWTGASTKRICPAINSPAKASMHSTPRAKKSRGAPGRMAGVWEGGLPLIARRRRIKIRLRARPSH